MQSFFSGFEDAISRERMTGYRINRWDRKDLIIARYVYNMEISKSLYNSLHVLEVALRNGIHREASKHFHNKYWFLDPAVLTAKDVYTMASTKEKLGAGLTPVSSGKIIARTDFGFWTNLLNNNYEIHFWRPIIRDVFPNAHYLGSSLTRRAIYHRLDPMRKDLRNRIAHYEPIWRFPDLQHRHDEIIETIYWLNKPAKEAAVLIDSFPAVYAKGIEGYRKDVQVFASYVP
jgi:hypothetical protein